MFYTQDYVSRISDFNKSGKISYEAILQILETAGSNHSNSVNDNVIKGSQNGTAWVLIDWAISILRRPEDKDELNISTWTPKKSGSVAIYRDFVVTDASGNDIIKAEAKSCLLNLETGKLVRISDELMSSYEPEEKTVFEREPSRLRAPSEYEKTQKITVRRSDIDFNGHVHNTRYIDYALEVIPQSVFDADDICYIRIIYSKPLKADSDVIAKYHKTESGHLIGIYSDETLCTMIELKQCND